MAVVQLESGDHHPENGFVSPESVWPGKLTRVDESVLPFLGGFGRYQKQLIALTWIPALFIGFSQYSDVFLFAQPNSTCVQPSLNWTNQKAGYLVQSDGSKNTRAPQDYSSRGRNTSVHKNNNNISSSSSSSNVDCLCSEWTFESHTGLVENVVTKWSLVCDSASEVHIAKFSLLVGSIFGYLVFGILADWFGRYPVLIMSMLFMLVFGLSVAFSVNVPMFSTLRFFEGFCLAGIILSLYVLRIELCTPKWRFSMTMIASFVVLGGQLLMPFVVYLCRDWQVLQAVIVCPLLLMMSYIWIFPESLRWLLATQQYHRSKRIIEDILQKNRVDLTLDSGDIFTELQQDIQKKPKKTCIVKMVGTRNLWKNIVVLCVNSLTGYGIHHCFARSLMDQEVQEPMLLNFYADYYTMAGIAVASCIALCPAVGLMGRRGGLLMFMIITALASLLQLGLLNLLGKYSAHLNIAESSDTLNKNFSIAFSIIGMFSSHAVSNLSIFFCAEITPTVIRGGGVGLVLASAGFGMLTAPIMELHNQKGYFLHHIIFACCTLICIICILLLPEPRSKSLPETLPDGESYTREPLLQSLRHRENSHLLPQSQSGKDYSRVSDTPLHEVGTAVVSTMESTASSAIELTAQMHGNMTATVVTEVQHSNSEPKDPNGHSVSSSSPTSAAGLGKDSVICASQEHLLSSSPLHKAPCATDPLLSDEEPFAIVLNSVESKAEYIPLKLDSITLSPTPIDDSGPAASTDPSPHDAPQTVSNSSPVCTTPIHDVPPSSTEEPPNPLESDLDATIPKSDLFVSEKSQAPLEDTPLPASAPPSPSPSPVPVTDIDIPPSPSVAPHNDIPLQSQTVDESQLDCSSPCPPDTSPQDPQSLLPFSETSTHVDLGHKPSVDSVPPSKIQPINAPVSCPSILPVTDIVHSSSPDSTSLTVTDSQPDSVSHSVTDPDSSGPAPASLIECTVSSPIDSGVPLARDGESATTENDSIDGTISL
ncbi:solute carrier family 22 member 23 [Oryzias latipes]|uniref:Major facilitator superfamily (MFS) profile domain-containing protein n=1 Tax=Oryzias latipes TaxID=8090 RepID=A0A3B3IK76_ORYLA|nr:solute carrier family 22 member 23 [Oryzias latipes]